MPEKDIVKKVVEILRLRKLFATEAYVAVVVSLYTELSKVKGNDLPIGTITLNEIDIIFDTCREEFPEEVKE